VNQIRSRPVTYALGILMTSVMVVLGGLLLLTLLFALGWILKGQPQSTPGALVGEMFLFGWILWYLNLLEVFRQLKKLDPPAYYAATDGVGFIARFWSSRSAGYSLCRSLGALELARYPSRFGRRVRMARLTLRILLSAFGVLVITLLVLAVSGHRL
jgi:hypothetical protein